MHVCDPIHGDFRGFKRHFIYCKFTLFTFLYHFFANKIDEKKSITVSPLLDTSSIAPFSAQKKVVLRDPCEDAVALASVAMATERCGLRGGEDSQFDEYFSELKPPTR